MTLDISAKPKWTRTSACDEFKQDQVAVQTLLVHPTLRILRELSKSVVLIVLYDTDTNNIVKIGSGFVADKEDGLIVTAAHNVMNIADERCFGKNCFGLENNGRVFVGRVPECGFTSSNNMLRSVAFRYVAEIVQKDPLIVSEDKCTVNACVLKLTAKLEHDVTYEALRNVCEVHQDVMSNGTAHEDLEEARMMLDDCEVNERIRMASFNDIGEAVLTAGYCLQLNTQILTGYVQNPNHVQPIEFSDICSHCFNPMREVWLKCEMNGDEICGPAMNHLGEVVGIYSHTDNDDELGDCYLVPAKECNNLVQKYKRKSKQEVTIDQRFGMMR